MSTSDSHPTTGSEPPAEAVETQIQAILASAGFANSPRMKGFLRYVVDETLAGRANAIKELTIAFEVFGRDETFDPQLNPVVRVQASKLRRMLALYYVDEGRDDPVVVELPKGSYVPTWRLRESPPPVVDVESQKSPPLAQAATPSNSIAVLPFDCFGGDPDLESFGDGLAEEIITGLAQYGQLEVASRKATFRYKEQAADVHAIGRDLGVGYLLEGSVRKSSGTTRVTSQLVDVASAAHRWAQTYDRELDGRDLLDVQDDVSAHVVAEVARQIGVVEESTQQAPVPGPGPERRQLTVLMCDLVDSTSLTAGLDPEDVFEVMRRYHEACANVVKRYGGHVARYVGDAVQVYFGYPRALEHDVERAVQAALGLVEAVGQLETKPGIVMQARVAIATGLVVIGESLTQDAASDAGTAAGDTLNLAARLQALAEPGTVVIGSRTRRLAGGAFAYADLGRHELEGFLAPIQIWRVVGPKRAESRFEAAHAEGITPIVGRDQEFELLVNRWEQAKNGEGQVVLLSAEPGIGKSRIVQALRDHVKKKQHIALNFQCSPYYTNTALYPVIDRFERVARFEQGDSQATKLAKLEALLEQLPQPLSEALPPIAALLSIPVGDRYVPVEGSPERVRQITLELLAAQVSALAADQTVLVIVEDALWIDPTTLELTSRVVEAAQTLRILVLVTSRPAFSSPWSNHPHVTSLALNRLGGRDSAAMVTLLTGGKSLPDEVVAQIITKTDGVPLFVEELTKMVIESGVVEVREDGYALTGPLPPLAIPDTLHDSLMARLDRLAPVKEVAQTGAVVGREFSYRLLAEVSPLRARELEQALDQIVESGMLFRRGTPPEATYTFKHVLVQDTAYQSLLRSTRQRLHAEIAKALESSFPEKSQTEPEIVAHHLAEAGLVDAAIGYWQQAGERAVQRSANAEAIHHYSQALEGLGTLPDTAERREREAGLQLALGSVHIASKGWAATETEQAFARARELCEQLGESPLLVGALYGLADADFVSGRLDSALEIADRCLVLAERFGDSGELLRTHDLRGFILLHRGDAVQAREHFEQALALHDRAQHDELKFLYGYDPQVDALGWLAWTLALLGFPEQALEKSREALSLGQSLGHPHTLAMAHMFETVLHVVRREPDRTLPLSLSLQNIGNEQGFPQILLWATVIHGWALSRGEDKAKGIDQLRQHLTVLRASGAEINLPMFLTLLADAMMASGDAQDAVSTVDEALALAEKNSDRQCEPELHRVKGEALLKTGGSKSEVEACFQKAIDLSVERRLKLFELRATASLCRLWRQQRKKKKARERLAAIYGWFTEGFDTPDLRDAKQLLDDLK